MVASSVDFLNRLSEIQLDGNKVFAIFDFEKFYPFLNIAPMSLCLYRFLLTNLHEEQTNPALCRELTTLLCYNSCFCFKEQYYRQTKRVPIRSPLAEVLAELVVRFLEETRIHNIIMEAHLYIRYIDDIFVV